MSLDGFNIQVRDNPSPDLQEKESAFEVKELIFSVRKKTAPAYSSPRVTRLLVARREEV